MTKKNAAEVFAARLRDAEDVQVRTVDLDDDVVILKDGTRLTESRADALVEKSLAEIEKRGLRPGRKSLSGGHTHSPVLQVRVPVALRARLDELAAERKQPVSSLVRELLVAQVALLDGAATRSPVGPSWDPIAASTAAAAVRKSSAAIKASSKRGKRSATSGVKKVSAPR